MDSTSRNTDGLTWTTKDVLQERRFLREVDGRASLELAPVAAQVAEEGYFNPATLADERERVLRAIVQRRGRETFRNRLITACKGRCAITGRHGSYGKGFYAILNRAAVVVQKESAKGHVLS